MREIWSIKNNSNLMTFIFSLFSACEERKALGLNILVDAGDFKNYLKGGLTGFISRSVYYAKLKRMLRVARLKKFFITVRSNLVELGLLRHNW